MTRQDLIAALWHGRDPFADPPADLRAGDLQGWRSIHPYLEEAVIEFRFFRRFGAERLVKR